MSIKSIKNGFMKNMPSPTPEEIDSPEFRAIWDIIKSWDVNVPEYYSGYCGANGSHVKLLLDALRIERRDSKIDQVVSK